MDDGDLFGGFDEAPARPGRSSTSGLVALLRDENAALRSQLAALSAARSAGLAELPYPAAQAQRELIATVTYHPTAPLELRHGLERLLRSARAEPTADSRCGGADASPVARALEVHYLQAFCWDPAGEVSGWDALQQSTLVYHRPLALLEVDTILFSSAVADGRGGRGRRGGCGGGSRRYWELDLGADGEGGGQGAAARAPVPGVLSPALQIALGMSVARCDPPTYLEMMRSVGYPPAYFRKPAPLFKVRGEDDLVFLDDEEAPPAPTVLKPPPARLVDAAAGENPPPAADENVPMMAAADGGGQAPSAAAEEGELAEDGELVDAAPFLQAAVERLLHAAPHAAVLQPGAAAVGAGGLEGEPVQLYAYPGLNAPPPPGADPRAWSALYAQAAPHAAPGPMRQPAYRPHAQPHAYPQYGQQQQQYPRQQYAQPQQQEEEQPPPQQQPQQRSSSSMRSSRRSSSSSSSSSTLASNMPNRSSSSSTPNSRSSSMPNRSSSSTPHSCSSTPNSTPNRSSSSTILLVGATRRMRTATRGSTRTRPPGPTEPAVVLPQPAASYLYIWPAAHLQAYKHTS
ncbi:hypothetical protein T492DRAFT_905160 [Pavlovales sp. CCMP2436]|nr:hypothetical protein T492DRAFT_905160 [Pavlovales sp. CCMP2436]